MFTKWPTGKGWRKKVKEAGSESNGHLASIHYGEGCIKSWRDSSCSGERMGVNQWLFDVKALVALERSGIKISVRDYRLSRRG